MPVEVLSVQTLDVQDDVTLNSALNAPNGSTYLFLPRFH
jgi:hypothetical protein